MKILTIKTTNFKRLGSRNIILTSGLNAITGPNGFGKTTLIEAILTCLYGTSQVRGAASSLKTRGAPGPWGLSVTFESGKLFYKASCSASTAELVKAESTDFEAGEVVARGRSDVTASVSALLGTAETFKFLHLIDQKCAASIARSGGVGLQRQIEKQTGVEVLVAVEDWCKKEFNRIDAILNHRHSVVEHDLVGLKQKEADLEAYLEDKEHALSDCESHAYLIYERDKAEQELAKVRMELSDWKNLKSQRDLATAKLEAARNKLQLLVGQRDSIRLPELPDTSSVERLNSELAAINADLIEASKIDDQIKAAEAKVAKVMRERAALTATIDDLYAVANQPEPDVDSVKSELGSLFDEVASVVADITSRSEQQDVYLRQVKSLKLDLVNLQEQLHSTTCPTCHQSMPEATPEYIESVEARIVRVEQEVRSAEEMEAIKAAKIDQLQRKLACIKAEVKPKEALLHDLTEQVERIRAAGRRLVQAQQDLQDLEATPAAQIPERVDVKPLYERREALTEEINAVRRASEQYEASTKALKEASDRVDEAAIELQGVEAEAAALPELRKEPDVTKAEAKFNDLSKKSAEYTAARDKLNYEIGALKVELSSVSELIEKVTNEKRELNSLKSRKALTAELLSIIKSRRSSYLGQVWSNICAEASATARSITEGITSDTGQDTCIDNISREGDSFVCTEGGHPATVKELSGAQEDVVGISVATAVAKILSPGSSFQIMDEPTSAMSATVGTRCMAAIGAMRGQVITVTHKENEIRTAENVVELG